MAFAIIDTSVYIDDWQGKLRESALADIRKQFVVRQSAVVLSELRRGARTPAANRLVDSLLKLAPVVWEPTSEDWWLAGKLIRSVGDAQDWETTKRREFQNDALIALTAVRRGVTVVTTNGKDFDLLRRALKVSVRVLPA